MSTLARIFAVALVPGLVGGLHDHLGRGNFRSDGGLHDGCNTDRVGYGQRARLGSVERRSPGLGGKGQGARPQQDHRVRTWPFRSRS